MLMVNVWLFVIIAVLAAPATPLRKDSAVLAAPAAPLRKDSPDAESRSKGPFFDEERRSRDLQDADAAETKPNHPEGSQLRMRTHQVTTRETLVTENRNGSEFAGNGGNTPENKRFSDTPKKIRSHFNFPRQESSQDASKKVVKQAFSKTLLELPQTQKILQTTMETTFIQGMVKGTLDSQRFRTFEVQDAVYLGSGRDILQRTAKALTGSHFEFANMYNIQAGKYDAYYKDLLSKLNLNDVDSVIKRPATEQYVQYLTRLSEKHPRLLAFGFLPCSQSYRFISGQLISKVEPGSEYMEFFKTNCREPGYESELERFINSKINEGMFKDIQDLIEPVYLEGMQNEENFIAEASKL